MKQQLLQVMFYYTSTRLAFITLGSIIILGTVVSKLGFPFVIYEAAHYALVTFWLLCHLCLHPFVKRLADCCAFPFLTLFLPSFTLLPSFPFVICATLSLSSCFGLCLPRPFTTWSHITDHTAIIAVIIPLRPILIISGLLFIT